jgi:deoxyribodipyrimidine photo-lyase
MWLASYAVHVRKVHWRAGADWMIGHLLDGDLASNHLSWQWIAGTGSSRPYLFNAANVARYAPPDWHSPNTLLDADYPALDRLARSPGEQVVVRSGTVRAPTGSAGALPQPQSAEAPSVPPRLTAPPPGNVALEAPEPRLVMDRDVWLVHPWALRPPPTDVPPGVVCLGVFDATYHARWPWSERRWAFVSSRMTALAERLWFGDATLLQRALAGARSVTTWSDPHFDPSLAGCAALRTPPALFREPPRSCSSFSQYWRHVSAGHGALDELLAATDPDAPGSD